MDFIAAVTTLLNTTLTSPASPILKSPATRGRRITTEVISALRLLQCTLQRPLWLHSRFNKQSTPRLRSPASETQPRAHPICSPPSPGRRSTPRFVPRQPESTGGRAALTHDFSLDRVLHFPSPVSDFSCHLSISVRASKQANSFLEPLLWARSSL